MKSEINNIRKEIKNYIVKNNIKSLIIGISGGIDSALVAALAKPVCKELKIPLIGRFISINSNRNEADRASQIGVNFCNDFKSIELSAKFHIISSIDTYDFVNENDSFRKKIRLGNIKARMRMIYLYNLANKYDGIVLSTDNLTEYYLGFWTIAGDIGDFGTIQNLWKTEVYNMSEWISNNECNSIQQAALNSCINADATDGLGITKTDLDQILPDWKERHTNSRDGYKEVDDIFINYFNNSKYDENSIVIKRYKKTRFKRNHPISIKRENIFTK